MSNARIKAKVKMAVDIAMTVLLLLQMGYHMMDNRTHEWTGVAMCVLFIVHHVLNGGWHRSLLRGKYSAQRVLLTVVDVLLTLAMVAIIASAVLVSRHVFNFLGLSLRGLGRTIHMPATMWGFVLMGLHMGLHWNMVLGMAKRAAKGKSTKIAVWVARVVLVAVFAYGVYEFIDRGLWMEMFMLREFAFLDYGESLVVFFASYIAILAAWATLTHYLSKGLRALSQRRTA